MHASSSASGYRIELTAATRLYDGVCCWVQPRAGVIPAHAPGNASDQPMVVMTLQRIFLRGSDLFEGLCQMRTGGFLGSQWEEPVTRPEFRRRTEEGGRESVVCDFTPKWHAKTQKLLGTGHTATYLGDHLDPTVRRFAVYSVYHAEEDAWSGGRKLELPEDEPRFYNAGAGSSQRVDLPNGDVLLPIYCKAREDERYSAMVVRCGFDGKTLNYLEHGSALSVPAGRGLYEPSLTCFKGRYYQALRNDAQGYVAVSGDGLGFEASRPWTWDDGSELGNYNTQMHWISREDALYLCYTRRGADNDHVFRHRAPLFIAEVDTEKLQVIRSTERILMPNRGARLGNFAIAEVSSREFWVTDSEWMQNSGGYAEKMRGILRERLGMEEMERLEASAPYGGALCAQFGADGSVWVSKVIWG